ncbi:MAG: cytochrome P450, partial [Microbacterium sp.]
PSTPLQLIPLETDPPLHTQIRRKLNPIFTERMAGLWSDFVRQATDALLDEHIESGQIDLNDVVRRLTATVNLALVGLTAGAGEIDRFITAPGIVARERPDSPAYRDAVAATEEMARSMLEIIDDRRRAPRDDVATVCAHLTLDEDDPEANDRLLVRLLQNLVAGGNTTTTSLIGHALFWLSEHPEERDRLAAQPERIEAAIEEFVRFFSPAHTVGRSTSSDTEVAGQEIRQGERVVVCFAAANRDARAFDDPDEVDLEREGKPHLAFGYGRHRCLGRAFARMTAEVVLKRLLERIPDFRVDPDGVEVYSDISVVAGIVKLPAIFTPGPALGAVMPTECPPLPDKVRV